MPVGLVTISTPVSKEEKRQPKAESVVDYGIKMDPRLENFKATNSMKKRCGITLHLVRENPKGDDGPKTLYSVILRGAAKTASET